MFVEQFITTMKRTLLLFALVLLGLAQAPAQINCQGKVRPIVMLPYSFNPTTAASSFSTIGYVKDIWGSISDVFMVTHFKVMNSGSGTKQVKCNKIIVSAVGLTTNDYCWGMGCYDTLTTISQYYATIPPGASDSTFKGSYYPNSQYGTTYVRYLFYDKNNTTDSMSVVVAYHVTPTGIAHKEDPECTLSASPNPANGMTGISYALPAGTQNGKIIIHNLLGEEVDVINLDDTLSVVVLMTDGYKPGVYFCSLLADGKTTATRKLVVAH